MVFEAQLSVPSHVYDLRSGAYLGHVAKFSVSLNPWQPSLYALTPDKIEGRVIDELAKF